MIIEELLVKLNFFPDLKGLAAFKETISNVKEKLFTFVGTVEAAGVAIAGFFAHSLEGIDAQGKLSEQIGVSVEQLQELQYAANIAGGSSDDLNNSLKGLNKNISEASQGAGGAVEVFERLGIQTQKAGQLKPTVEIFKELADKLKGLPSAQQQDFATKVGISGSTLLLLQKGKQGIEDLSLEANKLGVYSEKDAEKAAEYTKSWRSLVQIFTILKNQISIGLAPVFTDVIKSVTEWIKLNKELVVQDISSFIKIVIGVLKGLFIVLNSLIKVGEGVTNFFGGFKNILDLIGISAGFFALSKLPLILKVISTGYKLATAWAAAFDFAAFLPIVAGIALFSALAIIIQDIIVWFRGGSSVFGDFFGSFKENAKGMADFFKSIKEIVVSVFSFCANIISEFITDLIDGFNFANEQIIAFFTAIIDEVEKRIKQVVDLFVKVKNKTKEFFGEDLSSEIIPGKRSISSQQIPLTNATQISNIVNNSSNVGATNSNSAVSNNFNININSGGDQNIADAVKRGIYDASRQAYRNNLSPVAF